METVFTNADFISLDEHNNTYSVMVVKGKNIVYMGYSVPLALEGYDVSAVELVKHNLGRLKQKTDRVKAYQGNALKLKQIGRAHV